MALVGTEWYGRLKKYKEREGHCRVPRDYIEDGFRLGTWVINQRAKRAALSDERRQRLDRLGFLWEPLETLWDGAFERLSNYKTREGHCLVPINYEENGFPLGRWVFRQRQNKKRIPIERQRRLNTLGFVWRPFDSAWVRSFAALMEFKNREGHCRVPQDRIENGINLGKWVSKQRAKRKKMSIKYRQRLDDVGFVWDIFVNQWEDGLRLLRQYVNREGNCLVEHEHQEDSFRLGAWVRNQRQSKSKILVVQRQKLDELGFVWNTRDSAWERGFAALIAFKRREGHCCVPQRIILDGFPLGTWVLTQRNRKSKMSDKRRQRLDELGFIWDRHTTAWENAFSLLKGYKGREGHCDVPNNYKENGFSLGSWVANQRHNKDKLSFEQRQRLDQIGFVWGALKDRWDQACKILKAYKDREGHCRVPPKYKEGDFRLGAWVHNRRSRREKLSDEQRKQLDELGFVWKTR